jgi:hypothetical protein
MKFLAVLSIVFYSYTAMADGGVSGGGGNLISPLPPKQYQDAREIRHIIKGSKSLLLKFIEAKYALYESGSMDDQSLDLYSVIFNSKEYNFRNMCQDIQMEIQLDRPCFDGEGNAFDGSTFGLKESSICISAFTIAKKCDRSEVPLQSTALIFHEFSEKAGLSDDDAIVLQTQVLKELKVW